MQRLILILTACIGLAWGVTPAQAQGTNYLYQQVNALRTSLGLQPYSRNPQLDAAAAAHARWMVDNQQISHTGAGGSTPSVRARQSGYVSQWVSENIYGGTNASAQVAWNWWLNSPVHYRGIASPNYNDIGIGAANGSWGNAYVLVFGNSNGQWSTGSTQNASGGGAGGEPAAAIPPPFVVGVDTYGNIMHEIQPGNTLGDIALMYGYTWDDIPQMLALNEMGEGDSRVLEVGAVFLVPPQDGTYTPTPGAPPSLTPSPSATPTLTPSPTGELIAAASYNDTQPTATPPPSRTPPRIATGGAPPELIAAAITPAASSPTPTATPATVAEAPPKAAPARMAQPSPARRPLWLWVAVGVQVMVIIGAGLDMWRRNRSA